MCEISHGQAAMRAIFRESHLHGVPCDISRMANADIQSIRDNIEKEMRNKGFSRRSLATKAGIGQTSIRDVLEKTDNPGISTLRKIAEALELPMDVLTGEPATVPILGKIGAGGIILFSRDPDDELNLDDYEKAPRPPLAPNRLMALLVEGESMLPRYDAGDVIYTAGDHDGILPSYFGRYCAVRTAEGGTYLKILTAGSAPGRYTLRSLNAADMENVEVTWASPVLFVMPRSAV